MNPAVAPASRWLTCFKYEPETISAEAHFSPALADAQRSARTTISAYFFTVPSRPGKMEVRTTAAAVSAQEGLVFG